MLIFFTSSYFLEYNQAIMIATIKRLAVSLRSKLLLMSLLIAVLPAPFIGLITVSASKDALENVSSNFAGQLVKQLGIAIDDRMREIERIAYNVILDREMFAMLSRLPGTFADMAPIDRLTIESRLFKETNFRKDILGLYMVVDDTSVFYNSSSPSLVDGYSIRTEAWYGKLRQSSRNTLAIPNATNGRTVIPNPRPVITYIKRFEDIPVQGGSITIIIDILLDELLNLLSTSEYTVRHELLVRDREGNDILSTYEKASSIEPEKARILRPPLRTIGETERNGMDTVSWEGSEWFVGFFVSDYTNWIYYSIFPTDDINRGVARSLWSVFAVLLLTIILSFLLSLFALMRIFVPIRKLRDAMIGYERSSSIRPEWIERRDEIGELYSSFQGLISRVEVQFASIAALYKEKGEIELREKEAEFQALQMQINPHFLYNSLESISMMAELNNDAETQRMAISFGKLLRLSIGKGNDIHTLRDELELVRSYLIIQEIRFPGVFDTKVRVPVNMLTCPVPRLILQPLVENCIVHGFRARPSNGIIRISGKQGEGFIAITISDNGCGIKSDRFETVRSMLSGSKLADMTANTSIGIANVYLRLKLRYGQVRTDLSFKDRPGGGTVVTITIPVLEKASV